MPGMPCVPLKKVGSRQWETGHNQAKLNVQPQHKDGPAERSQHVTILRFTYPSATVARKMSMYQARVVKPWALEVEQFAWIA